MMSEFISSINQIAAERGIEKEEIFTALESAILVAYKKEKFSEEEREDEVGSNLTVELDRETGEFKLIATKEVVEKTKEGRHTDFYRGSRDDFPKCRSRGLYPN